MLKADSSQLTKRTLMERTVLKKDIILFDEFAKQTKVSKNVLESVNLYYQAIRKQNGCDQVIILQFHQSAPKQFNIG